MIITTEDRELLASLVTTRMPFGRYQGRLLADLPEAYLLWFERQGFPSGRLGHQLSLMHTIVVNGLEPLLSPLRQR